MQNDEIKILSNMIILLPKIEIKNVYSEEDYFNIFQLIDGYKKIEKYFTNKDIINDLLNKRIEESKLFDLIRLARNRYSHVDKHDKLDKLIILQIKVNKEDIHKLINEIKDGINKVFVEKLDSNAHKLIMNTKTIMYTFEMMKSIINNSKSKNDFDRYCKDLIKPIINNFNYEDSTQEEYDKINEQIIDIYKSDEMKNGIIKLYGEENYNQLLRMLTDDSFSKDEAIELMNNIKKISNN